jgi:hypothetical protein
LTFEPGPRFTVRSMGTTTTGRLRVGELADAAGISTDTIR